jgi:hypothetical protein
MTRDDLAELHPDSEPCGGCGSIRCCDCYAEPKCKACDELTAAALRARSIESKDCG